MIVLRGVMQCELDPRGRLTLPEHFAKAFAGLDREVVVVGRGDHLAIYSREVYEQVEEEANRRSKAAGE